MSEKKRAKRRKDEYTGPGEQEVEKPSKDEIKVAKWMKKNIKTKKTKFLNHNVEYFTSGKAIDALMKSKFAQGNVVLFPTREHAVELLDVMLEHKFFHRAKKVPVTIEELRGGGVSAKSQIKPKDERKDEKVSKRDKEDKKDVDGDAEPSCMNADDGGNAGDMSSEKKDQKRKRKIRLEMHPEQVFVDGSEAYVWIYDPIPIHYWIYGLILLLGAIGICLFPLWPPLLRKGVYYLSIATAGFLVFILALTVIRLIVFTIVWALTGGKLHFWIFPNLTEDVGFFASFWPLYESKYVTDAKKLKSSKKSKPKSAKKKAKDSDAEEDNGVDGGELKSDKIEDIKEHDADALLRLPFPEADIKRDGIERDEESNSSEAAAESDTKCLRTASESESEISGKDYEIICSSEVQSVK